MEATPAHKTLGQRWLEEARARALADPAATMVFAFHGVIGHDQVQALLEQAEAQSLAAGDAMPLRKRMMNVLVEGLENVTHHALPSHQEVSFALLTREQGCYRLVFGNAVPLAMAALISHRVGILNEMDEADLKEHYLKLLANTARSEHGGAGLGLLTMARKSIKPIEVRTERICPEAAVLTMELRVCLKN